MIKIFITKKYLFFTFLAFFLFNSSLNAQISITSADAGISGNAYDLSIGYTTAPLPCLTRRIEVQIGSLEYVTSSYQSDWTVDTTTTPGTIIFTNTINPSGGAQNIILRVKFKDGITCNNITQRVTAVLKTCTNPISPITQTAFVDLTSKTENTASATIFQTYPQVTNPQTLCLGFNIVKYLVRIQNNTLNNKNSYNLTNVKVRLQLAGCAELVGVYIGGGSTPLTTIAVNSTNLKEFITTNFPVNTTYRDFDVFVRYRCSPICSNNATLQHPIATIIGNSTCINNLSSSPSTPNPSSFSTTETCNNCYSGTPAIDNSYIEFPCPLKCNPTITAYYRINIPPGNSYGSTIYLEADIPTGLTLVNNTGITGYFRAVAPGGPLLWRSGYDPAYPPTKVRWTGTYNTLNSVSIGGYLNFTSSILTTTVPVFNYRLMNGTAPNPVYTGQRSRLPESCDLRVAQRKKVKAKGDPDSTYTNNILGAPSQILTYKIAVLNSGSATISNFSIEDILDSRHIYEVGSFRYAYSTSETPVSSAFINLPESATTITDVNLGTITVNRTTNSIKLYGPNFQLPIICPPLSNKFLVIEFDVKIKSSALYNEIISNSVVCKNGTTEVQNQSGNSTTTIKISPLYSVKNNMFVKCAYPSTNPWLTSANAIEGDIVDFKMQLINQGSIPIKLKDLINLKPQVGDRYEIGSGLRNSTCQIDYNCASVLINTIPGDALLPMNANPIYTYSTNTVNMARTMLTPPSSVGDIPDFTKPCIGSNWMRVNFNSNNGLVVNPGDIVEIIYQGKVIGGSGTVAKNSFTFNAVSAIDNSIINSNPTSYDVIVTNDGEISCPKPCYDCSSFDLVKKSKYLVSGWVREEDPLTPEKQFKNYLSSIKISFTDVGGALITTPQVDPITGVTIIGSPEFLPTGEIIDGWQRIVGEFLVPDNVDDMKLELINKNATGTMAYFDDIRVLPSNGNMKSFVYDQKTQRLMAELDENNYSTFYEYDLEGGLIRIKKETEKGVFTIQETRSGNVKK